MNSGKNFLLISLIVISFLCSCTAIKDIYKIPESPDNHVIQNVPFYPQETYQCGPASLAGVLNYWGIEVTPDEIAREIFSESARGTLNLDMALFAKSVGLKAYQYMGDMNNLKKNIDSGYPVIVLVDNGFSFFKKNHYMVVIGHTNQDIVVNSGKEREHAVKNEEFIRTWKRAHYWTLLIQPK